MGRRRKKKPDALQPPPSQEHDGIIDDFLASLQGVRTTSVLTSLDTASDEHLQHMQYAPCAQKDSLDVVASGDLVFDVFEDLDDAAPTDVVPPSAVVFDMAADGTPRSKQFQDDEYTQLAASGLVARSGMPHRPPWSDVLDADSSNSGDDSCVATVSGLPNIGHVGSLDSGTQCGPLQSAASSLPVLPFTPPDEGEAGSESRSVARPLGHVNSEGVGGLDGAHEASADASVGCVRCALDNSDTLGVEMGPQSDIHEEDKATSPSGTRSPGTCPGGGEELGFDGTADMPEAHGIQEFLMGNAAASSDYHRMVASILPDVYGNDLAMFGTPGGSAHLGSSIFDTVLDDSNSGTDDVGPDGHDLRMQYAPCAKDSTAFVTVAPEEHKHVQPAQRASKDSQNKTSLDTLASDEHLVTSHMQYAPCVGKDSASDEQGFSSRMQYAPCATKDSLGKTSLDDLASDEHNLSSRMQYAPCAKKDSLVTTSLDDLTSDEHKHVQPAPCASKDSLKTSLDSPASDEQFDKPRMQYAPCATHSSHFQSPGPEDGLMHMQQAPCAGDSVPCQSTRCAAPSLAASSGDLQAGLTVHKSGAGVNVTKAVSDNAALDDAATLDGSSTPDVTPRKSLAQLQKLCDGFDPGPLRDMMQTFVSRQLVMYDERDAAELAHKEHMRQLLSKCLS